MRIKLYQLWYCVRILLVVVLAACSEIREFADLYSLFLFYYVAV